MKPVHDGLKVVIDGKTVFAKVLPSHFQVYQVKFKANQTGTVALAFENDSPGADGDRSVFVADVSIHQDGISDSATLKKSSKINNGHFTQQVVQFRCCARGLSRLPSGYVSLRWVHVYFVLWPYSYH